MGGRVAQMYIFVDTFSTCLARALDCGCPSQPPGYCRPGRGWRRGRVDGRGQPVAVVVSRVPSIVCVTSAGSSVTRTSGFSGGSLDEIGFDPGELSATRDTTTGTSGHVVTLRYLLDTNIASAPIAKEPNEHVIRRLKRHGAVCAVAAPVWHELTYGCRRLPAGRRRAALEAYLEDVIRRSFPILPDDEAAATWHGAERARLETRAACSLCRRADCRNCPRPGPRAGNRQYQGLLALQRHEDPGSDSEHSSP